MPTTLEITLSPELEPTPLPQGIEERLLRTSVTRVQLLRLAMRGLHASEAARILGIHASTARTHYSDPDFRREVLKKVDGAFTGIDAAFVERTKTLTERLEEQATKSFEDLIGMLERNDDSTSKIGDNLRAKINLSFLDRVAETATQSKSLIRLDPVQLQHAALAAREMDNVVPISTPTSRKEIAS